jgi:hypothetical protein
MMRPTNAISILLLTAYLALEHRQYFWRYLLLGMAIGVPFLVLNFRVYHTFLAYYYTRIAMALGPHVFEGLAGNLISPARGLFVFSPVLAFSIYAIVLKGKHRRLERLDYFLLAIICLHWITHSFYLAWHAGHCFGPRFFCDMLPYFMYFMVSAIAGISRLQGARKTILASVFCCLMVISFLIHYRGATCWETWAWNATPVNMGVAPQRLWDWRDIQFLRGIQW